MTSSPSITSQQSTNNDNNETHRSASVSTSSSAPPTGLGLPTALKPIGFHNEQNTCFFNSTFQALSATAPLISLISSNPSFPLTPSPTSLLPIPTINPTRIPSLNPECLEPPLYQLLPVTRAFTNCLKKAWTLKDAGGGTSGPSETSSSRSMSLRSLLREIAKKYDQYDDYRQQDAHELLRHLLDSMEMEEKDVVKRLQPIPPAEKKGKKLTGSGDNDVKGITPLPSAGPSSPVRQRSEIVPDGVGAGDEDKTAQIVMGVVTSEPGVVFNTPKEIPENERLIPFVDVLFGGLLASVVVCENCKSVSHTYEGFLDVSLSLKGDDPKPRKRDRFKAMAQRLRPRGSSKPAQDASSSPVLHPTGVVSDTEGSDLEPQERDRRRSLDQDDVSHDDSLRRNSSGKGFGLKPKSSSIFRRKGSRPNSQASSSQEKPNIPPPPIASSTESSPQVTPKVTGHHHHHGAGPTSAQSAYIQRILSGPPGPPEANDPLAKLRAAHAHTDAPTPSLTVSAGDSGLIDSLKAFTSVEVLEGENAFACKKCWKINSGKYVNHEATVQEEDEGELEGDGVSSITTSPALTASNPSRAPPSISIFSTSSDGASERPPSPDDRTSSVGRQSSIHSERSRQSIRSSLVRAPSPLRTRVDNSDQSSLISSTTTEMTSATSITSTTRSDTDTALVVGEEESDGLSESDSSDDEKPAELPVGRPKMPGRTKSKHFVMRRAFKRYLIAKAPEVLVFHFKRFKQTHKTSLTFSSFYNLKKMDDFISFPERIDLAPFMAPDRNDYKTFQTPTGPHAKYMDWPNVEQGPPEPTPVMYNLYAVVVHLGTMLGGHYIAYCLVDPEKMFQDSSLSSSDIAVQGATEKLGGLGMGEEKKPKVDRRVWCYCSDTSIRLASLDEVLNARAYLCFYEKV